jgi:hypothetical protein
VTIDLRKEYAFLIVQMKELPPARTKTECSLSQAVCFALSRAANFMKASVEAGRPVDCRLSQLDALTEIQIAYEYLRMLRRLATLPPEDHPKREALLEHFGAEACKRLAIPLEALNTISIISRS